MTEIIALFNQSGGVGKSTLTMNLGYQLSFLSKRVLLIDIDPQASLTIFMGLEPNELERTIYHAIVKEEPLPMIDAHGIKLCPSDIVLAGAEYELASDGLRDLRLKNALESVRDDYDFILIDCPPSLGMLTTMTLHCATHILIPAQVEYKCWRATQLVLETVINVRKRSNRKLIIKGFIPTMYTPNLKEHAKGLAAIQSLSAVAPVFPAIPRRAAFVQASGARQPLAVHSRQCDAVAILDQICGLMCAENKVLC